VDTERKGPEKLWSIADVADHLKVSIQVVENWWRRGNDRLPEPDFTVRGRPLWREETIAGLFGDKVRRKRRLRR
jgi:transposase